MAAKIAPRRFFVATYGNMGLDVQFYADAFAYGRAVREAEAKHNADRLDSYIHDRVDGARELAAELAKARKLLDAAADALDEAAEDQAEYMNDQAEPSKFDRAKVRKTERTASRVRAYLAEA